MAEDENFDLDDDDLGLGDESEDSGDSDDFAGELDDMMGDDELGDEDSGDGDGELDSFFEDLSSIEDVEEADEGEPEPAPAAQPTAPKEKAAPAAPPASTGEKKGGALKWIIMIFALLLFGGGGALWLFWPSPEPPVVEETVPVEPLFEEPVIEVEKTPAKQEQPKIRLEPVPPKPTPLPKPVVKKVVPSKYLIQVATCSFSKCKQKYTGEVRAQGEPVFYRQAGENYDFIELVSKQVFSYRKAKYLIQKINNANKLAGNASLKEQSSGYRVTMGRFTALDRAKEVKFYIEKKLPRENVIFIMEHEPAEYETTKVFAGPYDNRSEAKKVLAQFRRKNVFPGAFLVRY